MLSNIGQVIQKLSWPTAIFFFFFECTIKTANAKGLLKGRCEISNLLEETFFTTVQKSLLKIDVLKLLLQSRDDTMKKTMI